MLSIPYWDFLVLNLYHLLSPPFPKKAFNSLLGFSSFESSSPAIPRTSSPLTTFNSLLGFSSFESVIPDSAETVKCRFLSIPYWDFLVLNLPKLSWKFKTKPILSIPYWDFLVLNQKEFPRRRRLYPTAFNSLLGFSSFESYQLPTDAKYQTSQLSIPYWDFLVLNRSN